MDCLAHRVGYTQRLVRRAVLEEHAEFVAAKPRENVIRAHARLQDAGDLAQQLVARRVAAGVVHDLELVTVYVNHCVAVALVRASRLDRAVEAALEFAPVDEARQASCAAW